jgi:phosphate starvation-inducible PhoH-like protein
MQIIFCTMSSKNNRRDRRKSESERTDQTQLIRLHPKTKNQSRLQESIRTNHVTIASGSAGVGKSLIAIHEAVWMLEKGQIDQILYTKPIVSFSKQKSLGFLPGDANEKTLPLLAPMMDNLEVFVSSGKIKYLVDKNKISFMPFEFIRGRSLRNCVILADEMQNASPHDMISIISRIEESSKIVVMGDPNQCDVDLRPNALSDALNRLRGAQHLGIVQFTSNDIVRNAFLKDIFDRYSV